MTGTFIDTIIICTMTGLSIVADRRMEGRGTGRRGGHHLRIPERSALLPTKVASFILMICLIFFAFTTILGWITTPSAAWNLSGGKMKAVKVFRWIYILAVFIGPYMTVSAVWTIADIFNGLMAIRI